jgi:signal transduction histidine kinase
MTQTRKGISEATFNDSLELIEDQVIVFRPENYELLYCNQAAEEMFVGRRANIDTWREKKVSHFITEDDMRSLQMRCQSLQEGPQRRMTWEVTASNGTPYEISLEYVEPENDEPRFISMYRDITARKVAEKAKNDFVATVSHELRTPLTSMKGALGLALSGAIGEMPEQMNKMVSMASNNCDKLVTLINDMLDIEKMTEGSMEFALEKVDLAEVVEEVVEANNIKGEKRSVSVRYNLNEDEDGMFTQGERARLVQLLENVVDNAVKFSDDNSEVIVSLLVYRGRLRVSVRDFGCGIPTGSRGTIFDKFTQADMGDTRAAGGTGLGLAVAKAITEGHNGRIFFASEEGTGSEFFIDLPRLIDEEVISLEDANKFAEEAAELARAERGEDLEDSGPRTNVAISYDSLEVTQFSQVGLSADQLEEEGEVFESQSSIQNLLVQLRSGGFDVEIETGSVSVAQIVSGKGVVGQSTVFNWLSDQGRNLITGLSERNQLANISVSVIQAKAIDENLTDALMLNGVRANLYTNWLSTLPELVDKDDLKFDLMAVASSDLPILDAEEINMSSVNDVQQALALAGMEKFDAVLHFDTLGLANCMTVIPVIGGKLPSTVPVVLVVSQTEAPEAERGVVSKFARSNPAGRGKSRRRSRG